MKDYERLLWLLLCYMIFGCQPKETKKSSAYTNLQWGEYLYFYKKMDSAYLMFSRAALDGNTPIERATAYNYLGTLQRRTGDYYGSQESLTAALQSLDRNNPEHLDLLTFILNELGNISLDLKRYDEAMGFYDSALKLTRVPTYIPEILNGKATLLQKQQKYDQAIAIYDSVLALKPANISLVARAISNRARTRWLKDSSYPALDEYRQAIAIRMDNKDYPGLNASYAHLSDYYAKINPDSALYYAEKMQEQAISNASPDDILEAKDKLIRLTGSAAAKDRLYQQYRKINDSLQLARDTTRSRFALIRYDVQKSKADNLLLQQHITRQRVFMAGIAVVAGALITGLVLWSTRRRQKLKQESELAMRNLKITTSQKVHDVVANGLYRIMNELEHVESIDKEPLLNNIELLYEKSRDISYEDAPLALPENDSQFHDLLSAYANDQRRVLVIGNQENFWSKITSTQKQQLFLVLSELMVNMKKHSRAKSVVIQFKLDNQKALISYRDDGVGFPPGLIYGNGLKNTVSRINSLDGEVIFDRNGESGLSIHLSVPLETSQP